MPLSPAQIFFSELEQELHDPIISVCECACHGHMEQLDGMIAPGIPVRVLMIEGSNYITVSVGDIPNRPPDLMTVDRAADIIKRGF